MDSKIERRKNQRYVIVEDISNIAKDLKDGDVLIDLSINGAKLLSLGPKRIGESTTFKIDLPRNMGSIELSGKNIRSKIFRFEKKLLYETGVQFEELSQIDSLILKKYISYLERERIIFKGREKIKELLTATKKLKKNVLILKSTLNPKKERDTTN